MNNKLIMNDAVLEMLLRPYVSDDSLSIWDVARALWIAFKIGRDDNPPKMFPGRCTLQNANLIVIDKVWFNKMIAYLKRYVIEIEIAVPVRENDMSAVARPTKTEIIYAYLDEDNLRDFGMNKIPVTNQRVINGARLVITRCSKPSRSNPNTTKEPKQ